MGQSLSDLSCLVWLGHQDTVLHASAGLGDVELISFFMGYGVEAMCFEDKLNQTSSNFDPMSGRLSHQVDPVNGQNSTPLHIAAEGTQTLGQ